MLYQQNLIHSFVDGYHGPDCLASNQDPCKDINQRTLCTYMHMCVCVCVCVCVYSRLENRINLENFSFKKIKVEVY